jgi:YD repeat-containing protein
MNSYRTLITDYRWRADVTRGLIEYDYDPNGRMELVEDPSSWATYEYDPRGRKTKETFSNGVSSAYAYDNASRLTSLNHKKTIDNSLVLGYAATYDAASRILTSTESPNSATTTYAYDDANRILSEDRTGAAPYSSDYSYNSRGLRAYAFHSEDGVESQDATYSYDDASRLTHIVESASGSPVTLPFTWWNDDTLKTYPSVGVTKVMDYDEDGNLLSIKDDNGSTQTTRFEYGYGFDGNRRWRKDHANNKWNWYPCGAACCAGDLLVLQSDLSGSSWSTEVTF